MAKGLSCPDCGSTRIWAKGVVPSKAAGHKQRFVCFDCGRTFYRPKAEPKKPAKKSARKARK